VIPDRPDRIPDAIEPLTGYRAWYFRSDGRGASLYALSELPRAAILAWDGANRDWVSATCRLQAPFHAPDAVNRCIVNAYVKLSAKGVTLPHSAPDERCTCGFYAVKEFRSVPEPYGCEVVLGKVAIAGKVIEHSHGYRAERARILELIPVPGKERSARQLALQLGIPLGSAPATRGLPPAA